MASMPWPRPTKEAEREDKATKAVPRGAAKVARAEEALMARVGKTP